MFRTRGLLWIGAGVCAMIGLFVLVVMLYGRQTTLPDGFTVDGQPVGGMDVHALRSAWQEQLARLAELPVELRASGGEAETRTLPLGELGLRVDDTQLIAALQRLFTGTPVERAKQRWLLRGASIAVPVRVDAAALERRVRAAWSALYASAPLPARRVITPGDEVAYDAERTALRIDTAALAERLAAAVPRIGALPAGGAPIRVALPVTVERPAVTVQSLKAEGVERKIAEFTTPIIDKSIGRLHNVKAPADVIQDMVLKPGEIFDFAKVIDQAEKRFGFQEAKVIFNGKLVSGIGGGICQVSTTLYNAALRSGLEIVERRNHTLPISYATLGQDATFSSGWINFRFRNNTDAYLLIRTETLPDKFTVKLFGRIPGDITYEIVSNKLETLPAPIQYVSNPNLRSDERVTLVEGKQGYVVETYRITKKAGVEIKRDKISKDRYAPQPTVIAVKESKTPPPMPQSELQPKVEDGVKGPVFN